MSSTKGDTPSVFIIDDEVEVGTFFRRLLERKGYRVTVANNGSQALAEMEAHGFNVAMVDLKLPDSDGLTLLKEIKTRQPDCEVIIMTGYSTTKTAVKAIQLGAFDYIDKPFEDISEVESLIEKALQYSLHTQEGKGGARPEWAEVTDSMGFLVGSTQKMNRMVTIAHKIAQKNINVLIQGETGTGKEVLARFIHAASSRNDKIFIPINCGALPENLLESELFGHERGAFTGATVQRKGIFEMANQGTLFLDEIGEASLSIQVKLLRVLETGEFLRVGGEKTIKTDVRIIAATHRDLEQDVKDKTFREDLFYRLDVVRLVVPPLRERREDLPLLLKHFIKKCESSNYWQCLEFSPETMHLLVSYGWPGNIRELANSMEQAAALCEDGLILPSHLSEKILSHAGGGTAPKGLSEESNGIESFNLEHKDSACGSWLEKLALDCSAIFSLPPEELLKTQRLIIILEQQVEKALSEAGLPRPLPTTLAEAEAGAVTRALDYHKGNISLAARTLGIGRNTLYRKIKEYNLPGK